MTAAPHVSRFILLGLLTLVVPAIPGVAADRDGAPQLLSTGEAPRWKNDAELRQLAQQGDGEACLELGRRHELGGESPPDYIEARIWYERAAKAGEAEAHFRLGKLLSEGLGGSEDQSGAFTHFRQAAEAGIPLAQYNVGAMLASGRGARRDFVEGLAWVIVASRDPSVDPEGEQRIRQHLARRPADIAAAEKRAAEIIAQLDQRKAEAAAGKR